MQTLNEEEKKEYVKPETEVIQLHSNYGVLDTLSMKVSDDEYDGEVM